MTLHMKACMSMPTYLACLELVLLNGNAAGAWFLPLDGVLVWVHAQRVRQQDQGVRLAWNITTSLGHSMRNKPAVV